LLENRYVLALARVPLDETGFPKGS